MPDEKRLGRGLASLLGRSSAEGDTGQGEESLGEVDVARIRPNPLQPRSRMPEEEMVELAASIRANGLLQPVVVREAGDGYQLIAGERRWQAAQRAGLKRIPVVIRNVTDEEMLSLALVENLQRVDLNPIDKARAFSGLMERFNLTQEDTAQRIGKERSTVANFIRLLDLPAEIQEHVSRGTVSMGHARALLALKSTTAQIRLCDRIIREKLSVRDVERAVRRADAPKAGPKTTDPAIRELEDRLRRRLGAKVEVVRGKKGGRITVHYADNDDLDRLLDVFGV